MSDSSMATPDPMGSKEKRPRTPPVFPESSIEPVPEAQREDNTVIGNYLANKHRDDLNAQEDMAAQLETYKIQLDIQSVVHTTKEMMELSISNMKDHLIALSKDQTQLSSSNQSRTAAELGQKLKRLQSTQKTIERVLFFQDQADRNRNGENLDLVHDMAITQRISSQQCGSHHKQSSDNQQKADDMVNTVVETSRNDTLQMVTTNSRASITARCPDDDSDETIRSTSSAASSSRQRPGHCKSVEIPNGGRFKQIDEDLTVHRKNSDPGGLPSDIKKLSVSELYCRTDRRSSDAFPDFPPAIIYERMVKLRVVWCYKRKTTEKLPRSYEDLRSSSDKKIWHDINGDWIAAYSKTVDREEQQISMSSFLRQLEEEIRYNPKDLKGLRVTKKNKLLIGWYWVWNQILRRLISKNPDARMLQALLEDEEKRYGRLMRKDNRGRRIIYELDPDERGQEETQAGQDNSEAEMPGEGRPLRKRKPPRDRDEDEDESLYT
ncbi:uncharacterized protein I303_106845 [Kwoniella dejecticola CBS 10117]|uniref:Uncharacterized protein n=1 Tax=Kwoniella dejecticola CBS 10117 TaxID=1296121 RepID=A0A1A5ZTI1_9TREE|nr:uncharacterized protein I303_08514 [Kwoniella dejecticola CBS 10117]OBR81131.1 hypothetical protein I303_08514 [Kwoniella dejecticola CBS 10117]